jgi:acid phosphatase
MRRIRTAAALFSLILAPLALSAQTAPAPPLHLSLPHEPANLGTLKTKLLAYHECKAPTCYNPTVEHQCNLAIAYLRTRTAHPRAGEKLALVLDIDETSLSNWDEEKADDFGYIPTRWDAWVDRKAAPAIAGTLRVYNEAVRRGVAIFLITGRGESQRAATADNLKAVGYTRWDGLALRGQHPSDESTTTYKSRERKKIVDDHYTLILNVGDQISDLNGPSQAERSIKLPDPFYLIP